MATLSNAPMEGTSLSYTFLVKDESSDSQVILSSAYLTFRNRDRRCFPCSDTLDFENLDTYYDDSLSISCRTSMDNMLYDPLCNCLIVAKSLRWKAGLEKNQCR